ncbi:hypothetical protein, partial [Staphylococcus aureus]|uniref:hypothetical protein n=1 Tax=Staphylococcus aureus TaxID=1280 RepID=UPI001C529410
LTAEQQQLMQSTDKGETLVQVVITDESGEAPIQLAETATGFVTAMNVPDSAVAPHQKYQN